MKQMYLTEAMNVPHHHSEKLLVDLINKNYFSNEADNSNKTKSSVMDNKTYEKGVKEFIKKIISTNKKNPYNSTASPSTNDFKEADTNDTYRVMIKTNTTNVKSNPLPLQEKKKFGNRNNATAIRTNNESVKLKKKYQIEGRKICASNKVDQKYRNITKVKIKDTPIIVGKNSKGKNRDLGKQIVSNNKLDDILRNLARNIQMTNLKIKESIQISNLSRMKKAEEKKEIKNLNNREKNDTFNSNSKSINTSDNHHKMQNNITSISKRDLKQVLKIINDTKSNEKIDFHKNGTDKIFKNNTKLLITKKIMIDNSHSVINKTSTNNGSLKHILELGEKYQFEMKSKNNISGKNGSHNSIGIIDEYTSKNKTPNSNHKSAEKKNKNLEDLNIVIAKNISFSNYNKTGNDNLVINSTIENNTIIIPQNKNAKFNHNSKFEKSIDSIVSINKNIKKSENNIGNEEIMYMPTQNTYNNFASSFNPETNSTYSNNTAAYNNKSISIIRMINDTSQELTSHLGNTYNSLQNSFTNSIKQGNNQNIYPQLKDKEKDKIVAHSNIQTNNRDNSRNSILSSERSLANNYLNSNNNQEEEFDLNGLFNRIKINPNKSSSNIIAYNVLHDDKNQTDFNSVSDSISEKFKLIDERMAGRKSKIDVKSSNTTKTNSSSTNSTSANDNKVNDTKIKYHTAYKEIMNVIELQIEDTKKIIAKELDQDYLSYYKKMLTNLNNIFKQFKKEYTLNEKSHIEDYIKQSKLIKVYKEVEAEGYHTMEKTIKFSIEFFNLLDKLIVTDLDSLWKYIDTIKVSASEITEEVLHKISSVEFKNALNTYLQNLKKIKIKIEEIKKSPGYKLEFRSDMLSNFLTVYENYLNWIKSNKTSKVTHEEDLKALLNSTENLKSLGEMDVYKLINNDIYDRYINIGNKIIKIITKFETKLIFNKQSNKKVELDKLKNSTSIKSINSNKTLLTPEVPGPGSLQAKVNKTKDNSNNSEIKYIIVVIYWLTYCTFSAILTIVGYKCMKKIFIQSLAYLLYNNHDEISLFNITIIIAILVANSLFGFLVGYYFVYNELVIGLILGINGLFIGAAILFNGNAGKSYAYPSFIMIGTLIGLRASAGQTIWIRLVVIGASITVFYFLGSFVGNYSFIPYKGKLEVRQPRSRKTFETNLSQQQPQAIAMPAKINNI